MHLSNRQIQDQFDDCGCFYMVSMNELPSSENIMQLTRMMNKAADFASQTVNQRLELPF